MLQSGSDSSKKARRARKDERIPGGPDAKRRTSSGGFWRRASLLRFGAVALVCVLYVLISLFKLDVYTSVLSFKEGDRGLFSSESAFHYRYARLSAAGQHVPALDLNAQWPEGLRVSQNITVLMEYAAAFSYRVARALGAEEPFHRFLVGFICFWSSLAVFPLYFVALNVWRHRVAALASSALYCVSVVVFDRTIGNFLREDFTLVLM
ncbi:MAG: hypothetical protein V2A71_11070, partial [Candidatus Eisenbacteria bacterium]